jgi:hypothetical protein
MLVTSTTLEAELRMIMTPGQARQKVSEPTSQPISQEWCCVPAIPVMQGNRGRKLPVGDQISPGQNQKTLSKKELKKKRPVGMAQVVTTTCLCSNPSLVEAKGGGGGGEEGEEEDI